MLMNVISNRLGVGGSLPLQPCKTDLIAWNDFSKVELIDEVYSIPNKVAIPANHVEVIGAGVGQFDGVVYGNLTDWNPELNDFSIGVKIKTNQLSGAMGVLGKLFLSGIYPRFGIAHTSTRPDKAFALLSLENLGGSTYIIESVNTINDNIPHSVVATFKRDGDMAVCVDGVGCDLLDISADQNISITSPLALRIASYDTAAQVPANHYKGDMHRATIWERALTQEEIDDYQNNIATDTVIDVVFSPTKGDTAFDSSGNGNHLTLVNADLTDPDSSSYFWQKDDTGTIPPSLALEGCGAVASFGGTANDVIDLGRPEELNFIPQVDAFEIEGWFKIPIGSSGTLYSFGADTLGEQRQFQILTYSGTIKFIAGGATTEVVDGTGVDGEWHFLRLRVPASSTGLKIWIDGNEKVSNGSIGSYTSAENAYYGARTDGASYLFTGSLAHWEHYSGNGDSRVLVREDNFGDAPSKIYVPARSDGSGLDALGNPLTIQPYEWDKLPYELRYPETLTVMNKLDTAVYGTNFSGTLEADKFTWTPAELLNLPNTLQGVYHQQVWVKTPLIGPLKASLVYGSPLTVDSSCYNKTVKYTGSAQWNDSKVWDDTKTWEE